MADQALMMSLQEELDRLTNPGDLSEELADSSVRCLACGHRCHIKPGQRGVCKIRFNRDGLLQVPWGYVSSLQVDPIEKKPFYHFLAGADALTFGMLGCNLRCSYCQNWLTSQALRESGTDQLAGYLRRISPQELVSFGLGNRAEVVASSYNEPLITTEWAVEVFREAKRSGLKAVYISNGFATREVLDYLHPVLDGFKVDLKTMQKKGYRDLGAGLEPVLESIQYAHELGMWVEIVTLLVPGFNDSPGEVAEMAEFIRSVSPEIPWHITAFRPEYKMTDRSRTTAKQILEAVKIGYQKGLHYVYGGNLPGGLGEYENTNCHSCRAILVKRRGFYILEYRITGSGTCPDCGTRIPGVWTENPSPPKSLPRFPQTL
jgi:pyruvate formate lyase activating enzyme